MRVRSDAAGASSAGDVLEGRVEAIVPGGAGIVRDAHGVVLVRGGLPGERVRMEVVRKQKRVRHARVLAVLEPSPHRVLADCPLHPRCGGCDLLDLSLSAALAARVGIVKDALTRTAKLPRDVVDAVVQPIRASDAPLERARRRARFVVHRGALTFSAAESHERVPIEDCPALHPRLRAVVTRFDELARDRAAGALLPEGTSVQVACSETAVSVAVDAGTPAQVAALASALAVPVLLVDAVGGGERMRARDPMTVEVGVDVELKGEVTSGAYPCLSDAAVFTQATRFGGRAILEEVLAGCGDVASKGVLELFAGAGHLTVPLVIASAHVSAVEGAPRAVMYLEKNLAIARAVADERARGKATGTATATRAYIDDQLMVDPRTAVLVADPPRTGIPGFAGILSKATPERVVLVSCDVATGARDIAVAVAAGYRLARLVPIDAFPRTSHVEWVATLVK